MKDETGEFAVFSEMGTSASQLSAAKALDAIARLPGHKGQNSDAVKAYRQVVLKDMAERLNVPYVETWVSLPSNVRPKSWDKIDDPVCLLVRNLYGHPHGGLFWEKWCEDAILNSGFERIAGWDCLFVHRRKGLFLSVYVDDLTLAERAE